MSEKQQLNKADKWDGNKRSNESEIFSSRVPANPTLLCHTLQVIYINESDSRLEKHVYYLQAHNSFSL